MVEFTSYFVVSNKNRAVVIREGCYQVGSTERWSACLVAVSRVGAVTILFQP